MVVGWVAVAGTAGWVGVLDCAEEVHCSCCSLGNEWVSMFSSLGWGG